MNTADQIKQIITEKLDCASVNDDSTLDALGIDSLELIELVQALEEEFGIAMEDEELPEPTATVADLAALVDRECACQHETY